MNPDLPIRGKGPLRPGNPGEVTAAPRRAPAAPVAVAAAIGIALDRAFGAGQAVWLIAGGGCLLAWLIAFRERRSWTGGILLLGAVLAAGGAWNHLHWSVARDDDVATFALEEPEPVRIAGRLVETPYIAPARREGIASAIPQFDRTVTVIECAAIWSEGREIPVSGHARLEVSGHLLHAGAGDAVLVAGRLSRPSEPRNPGAFDFRRFLRGNGVTAIVRCDEPEDVRVTRGTGWRWQNWQGRWRAEAERSLNELLSERTAPVGIALLLGTRSQIPADLRAAFSESGTMHILAISGANVAILASLLWFCAQAAGLSRRAVVLVVLAGVAGYSLIADAQPPVIRALFMVTAVLAGRPWYRDSSPVNGLALAALGVMIWNPAHLFDVGAQLSFLAVAALIWAPTWGRGLRGAPGEGPGDLEMPSPARRFVRRALRSLGKVHVTLAAIWLFTLPLVVARFNLISPIGFAVNLLLAPIVVVILWCGYLLLISALLVPPAAPLFAAAYDAGLRLMLDLVEWAAAVPGGHFYLPGPSDGWLAGYYVSLALIACWPPGAVPRRWGWRCLAVWVVGGLALPLARAPADELRCTFLSVGHGVSVLVEMPGGGVVLYDAGDIQDGTHARQTVQSTLWSRGRARIDALVISHADVDHFNAVPGLSRTVPIGAAFVHPSFVDFKQASVRATCDELSRRGVPIRFVWAGDRLPVDPRVGLEFLHPSAEARMNPDNANSLVLAIEFAGRRILLTGDLEQPGLDMLLAQAPRRADVLLAPHHGSRRANPRALAEWARPGWVIVSGGRHDLGGRLNEVYDRDSRLLSTHECGAITFVIDARGNIRCETFRACAGTTNERGALN